MMAKNVNKNVIETKAGKTVEKPHRSEKTYYRHCWCLGK
jgi:hypothetical protein